MCGSFEGILILLNFNYDIVHYLITKILHYKKHNINEKGYQKKGNGEKKREPKMQSLQVDMEKTRRMGWNTT